MKKVLFATKNPAKIKRFKDVLLKHNIELISIKDLDEKDRINVEESGKNALENAYLKAKAFYDKFKIPTFAMDDSLFLDDVPDESQPGTHVRRVGGKELSDEEMIEYYTSLVKKYGTEIDGEKRLISRWRYAIVLIDKGVRYNYEWESSRFYYVENKNPEYEKGYPLGAISKYIETGEYYKYDKTHNENREEINFVISKLLNDNVNS